MTGAEVLQQLEQLGTEQNRKIYRRHGVGENHYGVSFANLKKLQKKIKTDQGLAEELWATGNHDARVLTTKIADPHKVSEELLEAWVQDLDNYILADSLAKLVNSTPYRLAKMEQWGASPDEWIGRAGWQLLAHLALGDDDLPDEYWIGYLEIIQREIHSRKNRVRDAMNGALIAIGMRSSVLEKKALAAAAKIGRVEVDHGETGCKTPDATAYIKRVNERKKTRRKS
jgi:3-methyladenine DNA glycosylase AlkD